MNTSRIAYNYASALCGAADYNAGVLDQVSEELGELSNLHRMISARTIKIFLMQIDELDAHQLTKNILKVMLKYNRLDMIEHVVLHTRKISRQIGGTKKIVIHTAAKATSSQVELIQEQVRKYLKCDKFDIDNIVSPSILGGMVVYIEDCLMLDCSIANKIRVMKKNIVNAINSGLY